MRLRKYSCEQTISREVAIAHGLIEPTAEEAAQIEERVRIGKARVQRQTLMREALWAQLRLVEEPAVQAVLDLHVMQDDATEWSVPTCEHCVYGDMDDHDDWPCQTVSAIAQAYGMELPE